MAFNELHHRLKSIVVNLIGVIIIFLLQYALVTSFISIGLNDPSPLEISLGKNLPSISISLIFHLIPLNVTFIIILSWIYLNKSIKPKTYKPIKKGKKSALTKTFYFLESIPKGTLGVVILFSFLLFILFISVYPSSLYFFVLNLYWSSDLFRALVKLFSQLNSSLINAIGLPAVFLRNSISGLIKPLSTSLLEANVIWKYLICQNVTAWLTATLTLAYGKYREKKTRFRR